MHLKRLTLLVIAIVSITVYSAFGKTAADPFNKTSNGLALKGYDTVAYFREGKAMKGSKEFEFQWMGARWRFSSASNRDLFAKDPGKYAPQYGGYCAYGLSQGYFADVDPHVWKIVNDKLYLNYSAKVGQMWAADIAGFIARADENWPRLLNK